MIDDDDLFSNLTTFACVSSTQIITGALFSYIKNEKESHSAIFIIESLVVFLESLHVIFSIDITDPNRKKENIFKESCVFLFQSIFIGPVISLFGLIFFPNFTGNLILKLNLTSLLLSLFNVIITLFTYLLVEYKLVKSSILPVFSCFIELLSIFISYSFLHISLSNSVIGLLIAILLLSYSGLYLFFRIEYKIPYLTILLVYCGSLISSYILEMSVSLSIISDLLLFSGIGTTVLYLFITKVIHLHDDCFYSILLQSNIFIGAYSLYLQSLYSLVYFIAYNLTMFLLYKMFFKLYRFEYTCYGSMYKGIVTAVFEMALVETIGVYLVFCCGKFILNK